MSKKEVWVLLFALALLFIAGCGDDLECEEHLVAINGTCCLDSDSDGVCDSDLNETLEMPDPCGDGNCSDDESCATCPADCGACKAPSRTKIPGNYTMEGLAEDISAAYETDIRFRKDTAGSDNVSNFFYLDSKVPRVLGFFMSVSYRLLLDSRTIELSNIISEEHYVNDTDSLLSYLNITRRHRIDRIVDDAELRFAGRIASGEAASDYPAPRTGYQKEQKYDDWEYRNHTSDERVLVDETSFQDGFADEVYASATDYTITYKYHEYMETDDPDHVVEAFTEVEETGFSYVHALSLRCSDDLVITLYRYDYSEDELNDVVLAKVIMNNHDALVEQALSLRALCTSSYSDKRFTYFRGEQT